jgi:protein TonB
MHVKKDANEIEEKLKQEKARASRLKKIKAKELFKSNSVNKKDITKELMKIKKLLKDKNNKVKGDYDDKFWSKVSSIIMPKWNQTIGTKDGLKATVIIKIDNRGRFFYRNLKLSFNNLFDTKLKQFLDSLSQEKFPPYKKGKYIEAEFVFADKEEI